MAKISNVQVFGLAESIYRSGYPMLTEPPTEKQFKEEVQMISDFINTNFYTQNKHVERAIKLAQAKGSGHDNFLNGITVTFDLTLSNKAWVEAKRYTFLNFISSMSTMHRISIMDTDSYYNKHVDERIMQIIKEKQNAYIQEQDSIKAKELYLDLLYNLPSGFELTAGMITNYRCLKNIYAQRRNHRLVGDWGVVCDRIETLPLAKELIISKTM